MPSGLASLILAVIPLYVALIEMFLPGGEPLPARGWLGMALGFAGLAALFVAFAAHRDRRETAPGCLPSRLCWPAPFVGHRQRALAPNPPARKQLRSRGLADAGRRHL